MTVYIIRRLLLAIPTFFLATVLVFGMLRMVPGDVLFTLLGETLVGMPQDQIEQVKAEFGFDKPIYVQYFTFITGALPVILASRCGTAVRCSTRLWSGCRSRSKSA
jgi:ABC-type dipeptide/oligopeptide/nickel transport system permease component